MINKLEILNQRPKKSCKFSAPKVFIRTFGCQMNVRDTDVIAGLLKRSGYKIVDDEAGADVVIFNTCSVRQHAEDKVFSAVGRSKAKVIGISGCMANNYRQALFDRSPKIDFVAGTADIAKIPGMLKEAIRHKGSLLEKKVFETDGLSREDEIYHTGFHLDKEHAFVVISEGCENFCSYCVVPYVRGRLRSRGPQDILKEIEEDIACGITKITLLGQNVNAYQSPACPERSRGVASRQSPVDFVKLLELVNDVKGLKEFSFVTSHPKNTSTELFKAMAGLEKLKKSLHLPVQSGSDRILKLMNRGYDRKFYLDLAGNYRKIVRGGALTTDIIVGFPTEREEDFQDTYNLVKEAEFNAAFIFKYSPRPNTEALKLCDDVAKEEKERRHKLILELQKEISKKYQKSNIKNNKQGK